MVLDFESEGSSSSDEERGSAGRDRATEAERSVGWPRSSVGQPTSAAPVSEPQPLAQSRRLPSSPPLPAFLYSTSTDESTTASSEAPAPCLGYGADSAVGSAVGPPQLSASVRTGSSPKLVTVLHPTLVDRFGDLVPELEALGRAHVVRAETGLPMDDALVHWVRPECDTETASDAGARLPRLATVWASKALVRAASAGELLPALRRTQAAAEAWSPDCVLTLIVCGVALPALEAAISLAQLELGVSLRRVHSSRALAEHLALCADVLHGAGDVSHRRRHGTCGRASLGGEAGANFLAGLTPADVLHNKGVPRSLRDAWVGALRQLLPESAALALAAEYPSFARLRTRLVADGERAVQDVHIGAKRLGPARSRRLHRIFTAARADAGSYVGEADAARGVR